LWLPGASVSAEGEKATAKALRGLVKSGWTLLNDVDWGRGNIDHVLVGPAGVFLLETKKEVVPFAVELRGSGPVIR